MNSQNSKTPSELAKHALNCAQKHALFGPDQAVLLMASGGSDSTALAHIAAELRDANQIGALAMLHVNHKLRGAAADEDACFVERLAAQLNIPFFMCEIDIAAEARRTGENVEALARHERYKAAGEALTSMCMHEGFPMSEGRIATAHTTDDRIENFYMRSIVGTGPGGFRSMLYRNGAVVRPLLDIQREELRDYLRNLAKNTGPNAFSVSNTPNAFSVSDILNSETTELWREDATNAHTDRFRAYVRAEIVPRAREWNAQMPQTLTRTMNLIADEDDMLDEMATEAMGTSTQLSQETSSFRLLPSFGAIKTPLQRRVLQKLMKALLGQEERIDTQTIEAILQAFDPETKAPKSGFTTNIQGDFAVSSNKKGVLVEPMAAYRQRRKKA